MSGYLDVDYINVIMTSQDRWHKFISAQRESKDLTGEKETKTNDLGNELELKSAREKEKVYC